MEDSFEPHGVDIFEVISYAVSELRPLGAQSVISADGWNAYFAIPEAVDGTHLEVRPLAMWAVTLHNHDDGYVQWVEGIAPSEGDSAMLSVEEEKGFLGYGRTSELEHDRTIWEERASLAQERFKDGP